MRPHRRNIFQIYVSVSTTRFLWVTDLTAIYIRYPEMIDLHTGNLASALLSPNPEDVQERLNEKLRSFANGEIPHAADAISALFGILACFPASVTPPDTNNRNPPAESKCTWVAGSKVKTPPHRKSMNIALIRSMHHGSFFDMEYHVRKKRVGADQFIRIYLSSSIFRNIGSKVDARRSRPIPPALYSPTRYSCTRLQHRY